MPRSTRDARSNLLPGAAMLAAVAPVPGPVVTAPEDVAGGSGGAA